MRTLIRGKILKALRDLRRAGHPHRAWSVAFKLGAKTDDPMQMYLNDICTIPVNMAGIPGHLHPLRPTDNGLPVGLQHRAPTGTSRPSCKSPTPTNKTTGWKRKAVCGAKRVTVAG